MLTVTCKDVLYLDVLFELYKNNFISYDNMLRVIMKKKLYILPYSGKIYSTCHGIVKSNLLYNQCLNPVVKNNYCGNDQNETIVIDTYPNVGIDEVCCNDIKCRK